MAHREDILFCKIAITSGFISEAQAQKVLALCDKRERESGRRPLIGAVFTKYNLLRNDEVQKIYGAVRKRLGTSVGPERLVAQGAKKKGRRHESGRGEGGPRRAIDPQTLWMGVGALVAFLGIVCVMVYFLIAQTGPSKPAVGETGTGGTGTSSTTPGAASPTKTAAKTAAKIPASRETPREYLNDIDSQINDSRSGDWSPEDALAALQTTEKKLAEQGYPPYAKLTERIAELRKEIAEGGPSETTTENGKKPSTPPSPPPSSPPPAKESEKAKQPSEETPTEELEKELEGQ